MDTVLITGASSGIGMEYANRFAREGYNLILVSRRENVLNELAKKLEKENAITVKVIPMDLSEEDAAKRIYEATREGNLEVDILINNAGFATKGLLEWADYDMQHREMQVNMVAVVELTYFFISDMAKRGNGTVINIASASSFNAIPYNSVYSATKAFVLSFTEGIAYEYRKKGVKVMAVCPQATNTHFFDHFEKMSGKMRTVEQVVETTFRALRKGKKIALDGGMTVIQSKMHHFMTRRMRVRITGKVGEKIWGKKSR